MANILSTCGVLLVKHSYQRLCCCPAVVLLYKAKRPTAVLLSPVVLYLKAFEPEAVFKVNLWYD